MDVNVTTAIIAFLGVLISVLLSYLSSRRSLKIELEKVHRTIEHGYGSKLFEKRVDAYQQIFQALADFVKFIKYDEAKKVSLEEFLMRLNEYDSRFGLLFSRDTAMKLHLLRKHIRPLVNNKNEIENLKAEEITELLGQIGPVEIAMKNELGVYAVEFGNLGKNRTYGAYKDLDKQTLVRQSKKK